MTTTIEDTLGIEIEDGQEHGKFRADAKKLPGSPPCGYGNTAEEAKFDLLAKLLWNAAGRRGDGYVEIMLKHMGAELRHDDTEEVLANPIIQNVMLREFLGIPDDATIYKDSEGHLVFGRTKLPNCKDTMIPRNAAVDYLCLRVGMLGGELEQTQARRKDAIRLLEEKREELQDLKDGEFAVKVGNPKSSGKTLHGPEVGKYSHPNPGGVELCWDITVTCMKRKSGKCFAIAYAVGENSEFQVEIRLPDEPTKEEMVRAGVIAWAGVRGTIEFDMANPVPVTESL